MLILFIFEYKFYNVFYRFFNMPTHGQLTDYITNQHHCIYVNVIGEKRFESAHHPYTNGESYGLNVCDADFNHTVSVSLPVASVIAPTNTLPIGFLSKQLLCY